VLQLIEVLNLPIPHQMAYSMAEAVPGGRVISRGKDGDFPVVRKTV